MIEFELVRVTRELAGCDDIASVMQTLGSAVRRLIGADGATLVLREGAQCHYVDDDAIAPPWKGRRFPMDAGISGWVMVHRQPLAIPNIAADERVPTDLYQPGFASSLAMVPIGPADPIGALGAYWPDRHEASADELEALQALAECASVIRNLREIDRLTAIIEDATDALLLAGRRLALRQDLLDLRGIVRQCVDRSRPACRRSNVHLVLDVPETPVWIAGDSTRLCQAIANVVENGRMRTPERGRVAVRVRADSHAVVTVHAIPARALSARSLGMAVAKALVNLHDGSFEPGTEVTVIRLPLRTGPVYLN